MGSEKLSGRDDSAQRDVLFTTREAEEEKCEPMEHGNECEEDIVVQKKCSGNNGRI